MPPGGSRRLPLNDQGYNVTKSIAALLAVALFFAEAAIAGEPSAAARIARDYLTAYSAIDTATMARLLSSDAVFADQTAPKSEGGPHLIAGRDAFLAKLKTFGLERIVYDVTTSFESNGRNVFIGRVSAYYPQKDGTRLRWHSDIVTVVTVEDGKVVRHDDYANYTGAQQTVEKR
jgi:ketosteroid isomerase-like protein